MDRPPSASIDHPRYAVRGVLGRGAEGAVFEALDRDTGDLVALKRIAPADVHAFEATFERLARIRHPNVVRMRELVLSHPSPFFTMDLAVGVDFLTHVRRDIVARPRKDPPRPTLPLAFGQPVQDGNRTAFQLGSDDDLRRLRRALRDVALALAALHEAGIVHCDLHPNNVRVVSNERAVLVDFGLARPVNAPSHELPHSAPPQPQPPPNETDESIAGTSAYMAPERGVPGPVGAKSDLYALGVLLFEGLTGALPFTGSADDVVRRKASLPAAPPSFVTEGVPADLDRLAIALLDRDPSRRPDARACLVALEVHGSPLDSADERPLQDP